MLVWGSANCSRAPGYQCAGFRVRELHPGLLPQRASSGRGLMYFFVVVIFFVGPPQGWLCIYLSVYLSIFRSFYLSVLLSFYPSIY